MLNQTIKIKNLLCFKGYYQESEETNYGIKKKYLSTKLVHKCLWDLYSQKPKSKSKPNVHPWMNEHYIFTQWILFIHKKE